MDQAVPKFEIIFTSSARPVLIDNQISNVAVISVGMTLLWTPPFNIVRLMVVTFARGSSFNFLFSFCRYSVILPTTWFNFSPAVLSKNIPPCPDWPWKMRSKSQPSHAIRLLLHQGHKWDGPLKIARCHLRFIRHFDYTTFSGEFRDLVIDRQKISLRNMLLKFLAHSICNWAAKCTLNINLKIFLCIFHWFSVSIIF